MCHPPARESNLNVHDFCRAVAAAISRGRKVGVKLDFKELATVERTLEELDGELPERTGVPVLLNADVLPGPGGAQQAPLDAERFIGRCATARPGAILSLGWTPAPGLPLGYSAAMVDRIVDLCERVVPRDSQVTLAASATHLWASQRRQRERLLEYFTRRNRSLTLWGPSPPRVKRWIDTLDNHSTFVDTAAATWKQAAAVELLATARAIGCDVQLG